VHRRRAWGHAIAIVVAIAAACVRAPEPLPPGSLDPDATFALHAVHGGYAIDRSLGGGGGVVTAVSRGLGASRFVVRDDDGHAVAVIELVAPAATRVGTPAGSFVAVVDPSWDDQMVRLAVRIDDGAVVRSGIFTRVDGNAGASAIRRSVPASVDVRGTFRSELRDPGGHVVGWLQVRSWPPSSPRLFQGALPRGLPVAVGPALAVALASELDWIDDHTLDVYRGGDGRRGTGRGR